VASAYSNLREHPQASERRQSARRELLGPVADPMTKLRRMARAERDAEQAAKRQAQKAAGQESR
jgi:hypothetical protein